MLTYRDLSFMLQSCANYLRPLSFVRYRVIIAVEEIDTYCQSSIYSVGRILKDHFVDCLVRSAPYLFGSLQVLFDPVGLVRSVRTGLFDMVRLPLQGLQKRSLSSFLTGIGYGSATFLREISSECVLPWFTLTWF